MGSKGGTTVMLPQAQTQTSTVAPNPVALAGYANVVGQAQDLQAQHQGFTPDQQQAFNQVQQIQGVANPWINSAGGFAGQGLAAGNALINSGANAGSPQNFGQNINAYMSPYMDDVVKATMANINETNAQQQSQLTGNAIAQGALGGNRVGVAGAELARQQDLTNNATLAQILQQGYGQAGQNLFQNAGMQMQAGNSLGMLGNQTAGIYSGLGNEALSTGLQGANALLQTGGMQQALPYQQLGWLSGIVNNTGPNMGQTGTQNSMGFTSQYQPQPSLLNSIIGGGVAAAGAFLPRAHGGAVNKAHGGGLGEYDPRYDDYDSPVGGGFGAIPQVKPSGTHGLQLPQFQALQQAHQAQQQQDRAPSFADDLKAGRGLGKAYDSYVPSLAEGDLGRAGPGFDEAAATYEAHGGRVRGYDEGGEVIDDTGGGLGDATSLDDPTFARMIRQESGGKQFDRNGEPLTSPKGAVGVAQVMPNTAPEAATLAGLPYDENRYRTDPEYNKALGAAYYKAQLDRFGDPEKAAAAYNAGPGRVSQALARADAEGGNWQAYLPQETKGYLANVTGGGLGAINAAAPIAADSGGLAVADNSGLSEGRSGDTGVAPPNAEPGFLERLGVPKISPDTRAALISAGLGMMASKSHWLGPAIGEGGLAGVKAYYENQQNARQNALAQSNIGYRQGQLGLGQQRIGLEGQRLGLTAEQIKQQGANYQSEAQLRKAQEDVARAGLRETRFIPVVGWQMFDKAAPEKGWQKISGPGDPAVTAPRGTPTQLPSAVPGAASSATTVSPPPNDATESALPTEPERGSLSTMKWKPQTSVDALGPNWVPKGHVGIYSNPTQLKQENEAAVKAIEANRVDAKSAVDVQYQLGEMDHAIENLPKQGMLAPGSGAKERAEIAKTANSVANFFHVPQVFSENEIGSIEDANKVSFRLGAALSKSIGGREPGYIVEQAVKANPGVENTATGYQRVAAGLREAAQYKLDHNTFMDEYYSRFGHLSGAEEAFRQLNPTDKYVKRAIMSTIDPRDLQMLQGKIEQDPAAASDFDEIYGKNAAKIALGEARPLTVHVRNQRP